MTLKENYSLRFAWPLAVELSTFAIFIALT